nr:NAD(P)/FAD-dependent oxidoreductase [Pseudomonas sp.]
RNADSLCDELRKLKIDDAWIHEIMRRKVVNDRNELRRRAREEPEAVTQQLLAGVQAALGPDFDISKHFTPQYRPMQQRIAFVPEGDLFKAVRSGQASVVTDEIDEFTETGIRLKSGDTLEADIVITATGFNLSVLGDIPFVIDGKPLVFSETVTYRGIMFTGVPNMVWVRGYSYYSWTLRVDLIGDFVCRLLQHMKRKNAKRVVPKLRSVDADMELGPWDDPTRFNPGYLLRGLHLLPKRGDKPEWGHSQDYTFESAALPTIDLDDEVFEYTLEQPVQLSGYHSAQKERNAFHGSDLKAG